MQVKLKTPVGSAEGSWAPGIRDLPDTLAREMLAAGFAEAIGEPAAPAPRPPASPPPVKKPRKGKE